MNQLYDVGFVPLRGIIAIKDALEKFLSEKTEIFF